MFKRNKKIESDGYYFIYKCNDNKKTREKIEKCIDEWYTKKKETIKEIDYNYLLS